MDSLDRGSAKETSRASMSLSKRAAAMCGCGRCWAETSFKPGICTWAQSFKGLGCRVESQMGVSENQGVAYFGVLITRILLVRVLY